MRRAKLRTQHYHDTVSRTNFLSISILTRAASLFDLFATLHIQPNDLAGMSIGDLIPCQMTNTIPSGSTTAQREYFPIYNSSPAPECEKEKELRGHRQLLLNRTVPAPTGPQSVPSIRL